MYIFPCRFLTATHAPLAEPNTCPTTLSQHTALGDKMEVVYRMEVTIDGKSITPVENDCSVETYQVSITSGSGIQSRALPRCSRHVTLGSWSTVDSLKVFVFVSLHSQTVAQMQFSLSYHSWVGTCLWRSQKKRV